MVLSSFNLKRKSGVSIIEAIVALALFAIVMIAFMGLFSSFLQLSALTQKKGKEIYKAQDVIENVIASPASMTTTAVSTKAATITFAFPATTIEVPGEVVEDASNNFYIFIPTSK